MTKSKHYFNTNNLNVLEEIKESKKNMRQEEITKYFI